MPEIQTAASAVVKAQAPQVKGKIIECYFTEFLIQCWDLVSRIEPAILSPPIPAYLCAVHNPWRKSR